jgi:pyruvate kinase
LCQKATLKASKQDFSKLTMSCLVPVPASAVSTMQSVHKSTYQTVQTIQHFSQSLMDFQRFKMAYSLANYDLVDVSILANAQQLPLLITNTAMSKQLYLATERLTTNILALSFKWHASTSASVL